jgi:hypothetical protein
MNLFSIAAASLVFSAAASAQSLNFSGIVESVPGSANRYTVACSNAELLSPDVDLMPFVNQHVHITGEWNVSYTDPIVYVEAVQAVPQIFALGGTGQIGMDLKVSFDADPGTVAFSQIATEPFFLSIGGSGTLFIDLSKVVGSTNGVVPASGTLEANLPIPNNPAFVGLELYAQGATFDSQGVLNLTNPDCKTII